jgi:class 3 adenylate cyclase
VTHTPRYRARRLDLPRPDSRDHCQVTDKEADAGFRTVDPFVTSEACVDSERSLCDDEIRMSSPRDDGLHPITCRFTDPALEADFRAQNFKSNLTGLRVAHGLGILLWIVWGFLLRGDLGPDSEFDLKMRYGVFIPIILLSLAFSYTSVYPRVWQLASGAAILATGVSWVLYISAVDAMPVDYGYVGVILIMTFGYTLIRLRFVLAAIVSATLIAVYLVVAIGSNEVTDRELKLAWFYLGTFWLLGMIASYVLERSTRLLFLRERQLDGERRRSDALLLNVLPRAIVDRLKGRDEEAETARIADGIDEATVLFIDAAGFTFEAGRTSPDAVVGALDDLFSRFDAIADRTGLEKIKTVGDAYMAAAGVPEPRPDHVAAAAEMALAVRESVREARWPSGEQIQVRIGIAAGPVVAGVIGRRKFAYDLWGDTVNLASRLQMSGRPGEILVSEAVAERLADEFVFSPTMILELKGKGPTHVLLLEGRQAVAVTAQDRGQVLR